METSCHPRYHFDFAIKHCSVNKPLPDLHSALVLQLPSLKVTRSPAEEEINGNAFWKDTASFGAHKSPLQMLFTHTHINPLRKQQRFINFA